MAGHMGPTPASSDRGHKGLRTSGDDAVKLTIDYLKQETLEPLKGLGRFLRYGIAGSFCLALGLLLLLVGLLRLLQEETGTALTGDWSWVPYLAVTVAGLVVIGVAVWRITAGPGKAKLPQVKATAGRSTEIGQEEGSR
jgi:hypothetical protein